MLGKKFLKEIDSKYLENWVGLPWWCQHASEQLFSGRNELLQNLHINGVGFTLLGDDGLSLEIVGGWWLEQKFLDRSAINNNLENIRLDLAPRKERKQIHIQTVSTQMRWRWRIVQTPFWGANSLEKAFWGFRNRKDEVWSFVIFQIIRTACFSYGLMKSLHYRSIDMKATFTLLALCNDGGYCKASRGNWNEYGEF